LLLSYVIGSVEDVRAGAGQDHFDSCLWRSRRRMAREVGEAVEKSKSRL